MPLRTEFFKAVRENLAGRFHRNADKITAGLFLATDGYLSTCDYIKNHVPDFSFADLDLKMSGLIAEGVLNHYASLPPLAYEAIEHSLSRTEAVPLTADQLMSLSGLAYVATSLALGGTKKWSALKIPTGAMCVIGGAIMWRAADEGAGTGVYVSAGSAMYAGLAIAFHDVAHKVSEKISNIDGHLSKICKRAFGDLTKTAFVPQLAGIGGALFTAITQPGQEFMYGYAALWLAGAVSLAYCYSDPDPGPVAVSVGPHLK